MAIMMQAYEVHGCTVLEREKPPPIALGGSWAGMHGAAEKYQSCIVARDSNACYLYLIRRLLLSSKSTR